jgi:hypothetical protein
MTFGVLAIGCRSIQQAKLFFADMENAGYRLIFKKILNPFPSNFVWLLINK